MTDKDREQIKEMASDIQYAYTQHDLYPEDAKSIANALYLLGYCKADENEVVLEQEDYDDLVSRAEYAERELALWYKSKDKICKGAIKAFLFLVESYLAHHDIDSTFTIKELLTTLAEVAKQCGVEMEE